MYATFIQILNVHTHQYLYIYDIKAFLPLNGNIFRFSEFLCAACFAVCVREREGCVPPSYTATKIYIFFNNYQMRELKSGKHVFIYPINMNHKKISEFVV